MQVLILIICCIEFAQTEFHLNAQTVTLPKFALSKSLDEINCVITFGMLNSLYIIPFTAQPQEITNRKLPHIVGALCSYAAVRRLVRNFIVAQHFSKLSTSFSHSSGAREAPTFRGDLLI